MAPDDTIYAPKEEPQNDPVSVSSECFDFITAKTGQDRGACKCLIYALLYGGYVIEMCKQNGLTLVDVVDIRTAFDDFIEGR